MKSMNKVFAVVEAILWYTFFYFFLYCVKNEVNLFMSAFILVALVYGATISCPWFRSTDAWKRMLEE